MITFYLFTHFVHTCSVFKIHIVFPTNKPISGPPLNKTMNELYKIIRIQEMSQSIAGLTCKGLKNMLQKKGKYRRGGFCVPANTDTCTHFYCFYYCT